MPWCPVCKNEYKEGIKICAECKVKLVKELPSENEVYICSGAKPLIERLAEYLNYSDISAKVRPEENGDELLTEEASVEDESVEEAPVEDVQERAMLFVSSKQEKIAKRAVRIFMIEEQERMKTKEVQNPKAAATEEGMMAESAPDDFEEGTNETEINETETDAENADDESREDESDSDEQTGQPVVKRQSTAIYKNRADKAEEFKSSGIVLLVVGILGIICMVLIDLGILPLKLNNLVMMNIMMNVLFLIFIIFGVYSLRGAKKYAGEAVEEKNLTKEIKTWAGENLKAEEVDIKSGCKEDEAEEIAYFKRYEYLKKTISEKFVNLEDSYLDYLAESIYQDLYEEQEEA
ncbi:MAG: hypothetical protein ACI4SE_08300 [Lachnospiraceae bacterium]